MKKVIFLLLLLFAYSQNGYAQSDVYEELKKTYDQLRKEGKNDSSLTVAKKMNAWALQNETDSSLRYAVSLRYVGSSFRSLSRNDSALYYWNKSLEVLEKQQRPESVDAARCLDNLGELYAEIGDYKVAEPYFRQGLEIRKNALGENHPDYASSLNKIGVLFKDMGDYISAETYYKQALEIRKKVLGEEHPDYAMSLNLLGELNYDSDTGAAEYYLFHALEIRRKILGEEHPDYATTLNNLGMLYSVIWDFKLAENYFNQALVIRKKLGLAHPDYIKTLNNIGELYNQMGSYKSAEFYLKQVLEIRRLTLSNLHPDYISSLNSLGVLYYNMNDYKSAEPYLKQVFELRKKTLPKDHLDYLSILTNLGNLYYVMGDYKMAELQYKEELDLRKTISGKDHSINNPQTLHLINLYLASGDYKSAKMIKKSEKVYLKQLFEYEICLYNLGNLYFALKDYKSAEIYFKKARKLNKIIDNNIEISDSKIEYAKSLNFQGLMYSKKGDFKSAQSYFMQALEISKPFGESHPVYVPTLNNLGNLYFDIGNYYSAENYFNQSLDLMKKTLGDKDKNYLMTFNSLAKIYFKTNRKVQANEIFNFIFSKHANYTTDNFNWLLESQQEAFWKQENMFYEYLSEFTNDSYQEVPETARLNYNAILFTKSKILEMKVSREIDYNEAAGFNDELREELGYRRRLLAKLESEGSLEKSRLEKLNFEVDSLDMRLTVSWPEYAQQKKNLLITWDQVQQNLEEGEAAIEFVRFENKADSQIYYNALVLKKGDSYPQLINLCAEQDLQFISPERGFSEYYSLVWQPLEGSLQGINTIYYAPTGELYNVPFHAIYVPKGVGKKIVPDEINSVGNKTYTELSKSEQLPDYLMDRYTLHQLTSTRYLAMGLKQKAAEPVGNTLAMVGAVNYDYLPGRITTPTKNKKGETQNRSSNYVIKKLEYLEGTKTEVDLINQQVSTASWQTTVLEGNEATEEKITKFEGKESREILHLATHGFAFPAYDFQDTTISQNSLKYNYRYSTNPMVRSGLILAGGNWAWTGSDSLKRKGVEDGILTALEVSQLNLKKTKLVVLSACQTGLGKIEGNEGTFGLKRGFKLAGVEQLIVSLWAVPDVTTQELMALFYSDLTQTNNPTISFQKAQQAMREKYPSSPYFWAGFVMVR